jgi:hypothetical protein
MVAADTESGRIGLVGRLVAEGWRLVLRVRVARAGGCLGAFQRLDRLARGGSAGTARAGALRRKGVDTQ